MKNKNLNIFFLLFILILFTASFFPVFLKMVARWDSDDSSYCYLIIPIFIYLCWDRKDSFKFNEFSWSFLGISPLLLSIALIIAGELGSVETILYTGLFGCIVSIILVLYGKRIYHLMFPIFFLCFIVPLPPFINRILTFKLRVAASFISTKLLQLTGVTVLREGNILDLGVNKLQVVDACSGLRYLIPMLLMAILVGYFFNKVKWHRFLLIALVIPLSVFVNSFRIFATGLLTVNGYQQFAQDFYHDLSGWLIFMIAGGILTGASFFLKQFENNTSATFLKVDNGGESVELVKPIVLAIIFCGLFVTTGFIIKNTSDSLLRPDRITFEKFPMEIAGWYGEKSYLSKEILNSLWADDYIQASYQKKGIRNIVTLFVPYYEYQGTRHTAHAPQSCLLGGGWGLISSDDRFVKVNKKQKIKIKCMLMVKGDLKLLSSYFFFQRGRVITSPWLNKYYMMVDAVTKKRTDGALVRIEMLLLPGQSSDDAYRVMEGFLGDIWGRLGDYIPL